MDDFEELFERNYARLVRMLSPTDPDAEEAVQEAFVQALLRWDRVSTLEEPAAWVRRAAINRILNVRRSRARERSARLRTLSASAPAREAGRDDEVLAAVARLTPKQRMVVALYYGAGYSVRDTAANMGVSVGTTKFHLHAARTRLREDLGKDDTDD